MKTYCGLLELENSTRKEINELIISLKMSKKGYRAIATEIEAIYKFKISHTMLATYYKDFISSPSLDKIIDGGSSNSEKINAKELELSEVEAVDIDVNLLSRLISEHEGSCEELGNIYAYAVALCDANIKAHVRGEQRLKVEYVKYLKDVKALLNS